MSVIFVFSCIHFVDEANSMWFIIFPVAPSLTMLKHFKADTITVRKGHPIEIPAEVTGLPLPKIEWFKDDVLIPEPTPDETLVIETKEVNRQTERTKLTIPAIARKDKGYYTVSANNRLGTASHNVLVQVLGRLLSPITSHICL